MIVCGFYMMHCDSHYLPVLSYLPSALAISCLNKTKFKRKPPNQTNKQRKKQKQTNKEKEESYHRSCIVPVEIHSTPLFASVYCHESLVGLEASGIGYTTDNGLSMGLIWISCCPVLYHGDPAVSICVPFTCSNSS